MEILPERGRLTPELPQEQHALLDQVGSTVKAYRDAAKDLLNGKYRHLRDMAPPHLANPGNVLIVSCPDGLGIRFETLPDDASQKPKLLSAWVDGPLDQVAANLSQNLIYIHRDRNFTSTVPATGTEISIFTVNGTTGKKEVLYSMKVAFHTVIERPERLPNPPQKPFCLLSVRNILQIGLLGEYVDDQPSIQHGTQFMLRSTLRLPVGWDCIEVYPFFNLDHWKPEWAHGWAENDILAAIVARQAEDSHYASLDPCVTARREYGALLREYKELLDSPPKNEEVLQAFMRDHPSLLCPAKVRMWPKLALGSKQTDFVFKEATNEYLLVELEAANRQLFLQNGHTARDLNHARGQITDWKRYLEDNRSYVEHELGLEGISTNPNSLIVIGRSASLNADNRRTLLTLQNQNPKDRILTYDDVYDNAKAVIENLLGPIWKTTGDTEIYYLPTTPSDG